MSSAAKAQRRLEFRSLPPSSIPIHDYRVPFPSMAFGFKPVAGGNAVPLPAEIVCPRHTFLRVLLDHEPDKMQFLMEPNVGDSGIEFDGGLTREDELGERTILKRRFRWVCCTQLPFRTVAEEN